MKEINKLKTIKIMTDQEILEELTDQRDWWKKAIEDAQKKVADYRKELAKVERLIELLEQKSMEN